MQVQVNTDHNIHGGEKLTAFVTTELESSLSRFDGWLTRVEVHLSADGSAHGRTEDTRCVIEARPAGAQVVAVTHHAGSVDDAYSGAVHKLGKVLDTKYSRRHDHKGGESIRHLPVVDDPAEVELLTKDLLTKDDEAGR